MIKSYKIFLNEKDSFDDEEWWIEPPKEKSHNQIKRDKRKEDRIRRRIERENFVKPSFIDIFSDKINRVRGRDIANRKVCIFRQNFPGLDGDCPQPNRREDVRLNDYYNEKTNIYTCPTCGKVSNQIMEHGDGWICGRCGLKTRIFGNSLRYWN